MVKLKKGQETFTVLSGPDEGKTYRPGTEYKDVPKGYEKRFEKVKLGIQPEPVVKEHKRSKK